MKKRILYLITFLTIIGINYKLISQNENITITYERNPDKSVDFSYNKKLPGSYYLKLEFQNLMNCYQTVYEDVIKDGSGHLIKLKPIDSKQHVNFSYKYSSIRGNPNPKIDKSFNYVFPFKTGKSIKILESTSLKEKYFNAEKDSNWKSYIVDRINADTIYGMRKGIVIEIVDKFETDSLDEYIYTSSMNKIVIEHNDGTISNYIGFNKKSIFVKLGQTVYPQTKLGVLNIFNNSTYRLYFDISYLKETNLDHSKKRTLNSQSQMEHITPYFFNSNGSLIVKNNNEYLVEIDEITRFKEFTKREMKQYMKNPQVFN
ncbi:MAG: hypothetical protein A3F91_13275 [Flavobacteria bacterium RIFCSPLOWO2_12_FULL_35_11]|nr:MAG: hypothetical protein A3F91_13275 [Flavobacteria bacterium RIFCSPLOWO2_12_FULL_35_11]